MPKKPNSRKATRVRVNAWVDEAVAPLVEALNDFPDLVTLSSSEGNNGQAAWVSFAHKGMDAGETLAFIQFLTAEITSRIDAECGCRIGLEWTMGGSESTAKVEAPLAAIQELASALAEVASHEAVS